MKLNLIVSQPADQSSVQPNQSFQVKGYATDQGVPGEPVMVDSVTVQVDGGTPIQAALTRVPTGNFNITEVKFQATVEITGGQDPHTIKVTATDDNAISQTKSVQVFTGPIFQVDTPAVLLEISPFPVDPTSPAIVGWLSQIQQQLVPMSNLLGSVGKVLSGPNVSVVSDAQGVQTLRIGLWIEDPGFPVNPPVLPNFPLPRLSNEGAAACFAQTARLPVPGIRSFGPAFAVSIPLKTLQGLLDAAAPMAKQTASDNDATLESLTAQMSPPATVVTSFSGHLPLDIPFSITIKETLGTVQLPDSSQMVPAVIGSSHDSSTGSFLDWFVSALFPMLFITLSAISGEVSSAAGQVEGQITGVMGPLIASIPSRLPFRNTSLPPDQLFHLPDFPVLVPDWESFGVTDTGILATGTTTIEARDESMVGMAISGSQHIIGYQEDLAGGAGQGYQYFLSNLAPDPDKFKWQVTGTGSDAGGIDRDPLGESGIIEVNYPLSLHVALGIYPFTLTVSATETCGTDPSKTLSAFSQMEVKVEVKKNPKLPPAPPPQGMEEEVKKNTAV